MSDQPRLGRQRPDELAGSGWPFAPAAAFRTQAGAALPRDAVADLALTLPGPPAGLAVRRVAVAAGVVTLSFVGDDRAVAATASWRPAAAPPVVAVRDPAGRAVGALVPGPGAAGLAALGPGEHPVAAAGLPLAAGACGPAPAAGVSGLRLPDGTLLAGVVPLVAGVGTGLAVAPGFVPGPGLPKAAPGLRLSAAGEPAGAAADPAAPCPPAAPRRPVTAVRVVRPDGTEFTLTPDASGRLPVFAERGLVSAPALVVRGTAAAGGGAVTLGPGGVA